MAGGIGLDRWGAGRRGRGGARRPTSARAVLGSAEPLTTRTPAPVKPLSRSNARHFPHPRPDTPPPSVAEGCVLCRRRAVAACKPANRKGQSRFSTLCPNRHAPPGSPGPMRERYTPAAIIPPTVSRPETTVARGTGLDRGAGQSKQPWRSAQASVRDSDRRQIESGDHADSGLAVSQDWSNAQRSGAFA